MSKMPTIMSISLSNGNMGSRLKNSAKMHPTAQISMADVYHLLSKNTSRFFGL